MTNCPPCLLTEAERKTIASMRHLQKVALRGGKITAYLDGKGGWKVKETINR